MKKLPVSIGILSWKGYKSLENSLLSYRSNGLNSLSSDKYICLPEFTQEGINLSRKFGYRTILFKNNIGILSGFKELAKKMPSGPLLLLENDLPLVENKEETFKQLSEALQMLKKSNVAQVRLRSKKIPGEPFHGIDKYKKYWDHNSFSYLRRTLRPFKARRLIGTSVYVHDNPHQKHPQYITKLPNGFYSISTKVMNWSNLGILVDKNFFLNVIIKEAENTSRKSNVNGFKNIEIELNKAWWRNQNWNIIVSPGLFTHERLSDRGY